MVAVISPCAAATATVCHTIRDACPIRVRRGGVWRVGSSGAAVAASRAPSCTAPCNFRSSSPPLAHAFLEVRGEAAGDDRATAVHTLDDIGGDGGVRLAEHVDPALAPALLGGPASTGVVVVASGGGGRRTCRPDAELLLLGVDAAVQAEARDAVALRRDVRHRAVEKLLEATERQLPARGGLPVRSRIERNWE